MAASDLASTQVIEIKGASKNLGGMQSNFMSAQTMEQEYKKRLPREVKALLRGRDVVGLTGINPKRVAAAR